MDYRNLSTRLVFLAVAGAFAADAWAQAAHRVGTADGTTVHEDAPIASPAQTAPLRAVPPSRLSAPPAAAPMQRPVAVPLSPELAVRSAPPVNPALLAGTPAMNDYRQCMRDNAAAIARMRAAEDVVRAQNSLKVAREHGVATPYSEERLQRQWQYFKSLGGSGASPDQVTVPEDPCKSALQALQRALAAKEGELAQCLSTEAGKVKLASLSRDVLMTRRYLDLLEHGQAPSEPNKRVTPAEVRALLERQFQDYRRNGGTAVRVEDVREIENPCVPRVATPSQPLTQTRTRVLTTP